MPFSITLDDIYPDNRPPITTDEIMHSAQAAAEARFITYREPDVEIDPRFFLGVVEMCHRIKGLEK